MDFASLAAECAPWVATQTMAAIVRTESQLNLKLKYQLLNREA